MTEPASPDAESRPRPCPVCGKPPVEPHRPFCSARCRQVDLGRWLTGTYRIETDEQPGDRLERSE